MAYRPSVAPPLLIVKGDNRGDKALTKRFYWLDFQLVLGPGHTEDFKNGSGPCLHCTQHKAGTMKHNWLAWCQHNVTGWVSMWAYDMLSQ